MPRIDKLLAHPSTAPLVHVDHGHRKPTPKVASVGVGAETPELTGRWGITFKFFKTYMTTASQVPDDVPPSIRPYVDPLSRGYFIVDLEVKEANGLTIRIPDSVLVFRMPNNQLGFQLISTLGDDFVTYDKYLIMAVVHDAEFMQLIQKDLVRKLQVPGAGFPLAFVQRFARSTPVAVPSPDL
tara:strand:- start:433 stop:981 length:549 start_codon:yes stop_codon:yes gene_type:complete